MNVVAILASPRKNGNTNILADQVIQGLQKAGNNVQIEKIFVNELNLKPCLGTLSCRKSGVCIIKDDMKAILSKIKEADGMILASPIYRRYLPGQMKNFMDRITPLENETDMKSESESIKWIFLLMNVIPGFIIKKMIRKMYEKMGSKFRLNKKIHSVVITAGGHPGELKIMNEDMERVAEELSFFSIVTNGKVVDSIKAPGIFNQGEILRQEKIMNRAFHAGEELAALLYAG